MVRLELKVNGKNVRAEDFGKRLKKAVTDQVRDELTSRVKRLRDPATGKPARVKITGQSLEDMSIEVRGSKALIDTVKRTLK